MEDPDYKKPVDFLQWLIEAAQGDEQKTGHLCARIQVLNFASIHTTSIVQIHGLTSTDLDFHEYII